MSSADTPARPGLKLHPASLLFELLVTARQLVPVIAGTLLASGNDRWAKYFLQFLILAAVLMTMAAAIRVLTARYWIESDEIVVREGLLFRRVRHMPFERIQNVLLQQNLLHRPFALYTVRLETGAGAEADANLRVLPLNAARAIEAAVRQRGDALAGASSQSDPSAQNEAQADSSTILQLNLREVLLAGLVLDRGFLIVAAGLFGFFQLDLPWLDPGVLAKRGVSWLMQLAGGLNAWSLGLVILSFFLLVKLVTVTLSVLQALLLWYGFRLDRDGPRLRTQSGLLSRARASATPDRVQIVSIYDGLWLRLLRRRAIGASVSGASTAFNAEPGLAWLAPIVNETASSTLVRSALPGAEPIALSWQSLHPATHLRLARRSLLLHVLLGIAVSLLWSWKLLPLVVLLAILGQLHAWSWTRTAGYAFDGQYLAWRSGVTQRITWIVPVARIAGLRLSSSPFDRRHGSVNLILDTQAPQREHSLRMQYLPRDAAQQLAAVLRQGIEDQAGRV